MACYGPQANITMEGETSLASENNNNNKTQPRHNYTDSVMKTVASMTSRLSPDDIVDSDDMSKKCECHNQDKILYTVITTTLVNIVILLAFSLICSNSRKPGVEVKQDILCEEETENFKPILKAPDNLQSPYECI